VGSMALPRWQFSQKLTVLARGSMDARKQAFSIRVRGF
jgi:hypothetical protein